MPVQGAESKEYKLAHANTHAYTHTHDAVPCHPLLLSASALKVGLVLEQEADLPLLFTYR